MELVCEAAEKTNIPASMLYSKEKSDRFVKKGGALVDVSCVALTPLF